MIRSLLLAIAVLWPSFVRAQSDRPGYLPREVRDTLVTGVRTEFTSADGATDVRRDRLPALFVEEGTPATPFLPPGRFRATFSGWLQLRLRGDFEFRVAGRGAVKLSFEGEEVLTAGPGELGETEPVSVAMLKGYNALRLEYESPPDRDATLRVYWRSDEFPWEPLPVDRLWCDGTETELAEGLDRRAGREAFGVRMCARCHDTGVELGDGSFAGLPELGRDAPSLGNAANALEPAWVAAWLTDPMSVRNDVTMPSVLHGFSEEARVDLAAHLAAYVRRLGAVREATLQPATDEQLERGEFLYETRGCLTCHRFTPPGEEDEFDRVSLHFVAAKFRPGQLAEFLADSRKHHRWSRMPRFDFSAEESADLETHLRKKSTGRVPELREADADLGREAFMEQRCAQCHSDTLPAMAWRPVRGMVDTDRLNAGCLATEPPASVPDFRFDEDARRALTAFLTSSERDSSLERRVPVEVSHRVVTSMRCTACHARDDVDARLPLLSAEEGELGLIADPVPGLSWVGEKLRPSWSKQLFAGTLGYRLRDHFRTRMPAFPARGELLAEGLSAEHGYDPDDEPAVEYEADLAWVGAAVAAPQTGLSCIRCHPIADQPPTAPEQARSTNLSYTRRRMREEFYTRWMLFPQQVEPNTRMIRFAPDGTKTGLDSIYEGDAREQFEAVWHWLGQLHEERVRMEDGGSKNDEGREP